MPSDEQRDRAAATGMDASVSGPTVDIAPAERHLPAVGRYHLIQKIGEGGMGEVWLAEQREPVRRRVALKLVKAGMDSREVTARFESERQALALMNHSAISRVLDAGATSQGAPYFVMEYVAGVPITEYCDTHRLTTRERLELFIPVCEGVQHAHHKAIIHRDLKPSNILVQEVDGRAVPKIIDFGVAKALTGDLGNGGMLTRVGTLIGTPEYMSPEQAASSGEDIDTRSDVYSLGIVFYELLAGSPPLYFKGTALHEFVRRLRDEEPPKPSTRLQQQSREASKAQAQKLRTEPLTLEKQLRGDLDAIALKALEKERSRRYNSPADFAADIRRYLNNEAVLAVPPSVGYRARKLARRYRVALATAAAFILVLIAASVVSIRQSLRANREAATAKAINNFLQDDVLAQADSYRQESLGVRPDPDLKVRIALDRAAARIAGKFDNQPEVEASIRHTIGMTYANLGINPEARTHFQRSLDLYRKIEGPKGEDTLDLMRHLGRALMVQGNYAEAQTLLGECLREARSRLGPEHEITLGAVFLMGQLKMATGQYREAEPLIQTVVEVDRQARGPEDRSTIVDMLMLGRIRLEESKNSEAEAILSPLAEISRRRFGPTDTETLQVLNLLGQVYIGQGKFEQAEAIMKEAVAGHHQAFGPEHPATLAANTALANVYAGEGRYAEAEALHLQVLEIKRRTLGPTNRQTLNSLSYIVSLYQQQGKYAQALPYAEEALAAKRRTVGPDSPVTMNAAEDLTLTYVALARFSAAEPLAREAQDWFRNKRPDAPERFFAASLLGASLAGQKKYAEAEPLLLDGYQGMVAREQADASNRFEINLAGRWIDELYRGWGKPEQVSHWRQTRVPPKSVVP